MKSVKEYVKNGRRYRKEVSEIRTFSSIARKVTIYVRVKDPDYGYLWSVVSRKDEVIEIAPECEHRAFDSEILDAYREYLDSRRFW